MFLIGMMFMIIVLCQEVNIGIKETKSLLANMDLYGVAYGAMIRLGNSQYLDLSKIQEGVISRDERFGYVELANISADPKDFINVYTDTSTIKVATWQRFDLQ